MAVQITEFNLKERSFQTIPLESLTSSNKDVVYWIHSDLQDPFPNDLRLPEATIELCNDEDTIPKLRSLGDDALTLRIQALKTNNVTSKKDVEFCNLVIHLTSHYCLTACREKIPAIDAFEESYPKALTFAETPCFILFLILDGVINDYSNVLFELEDIADQMELVADKDCFDDAVHLKQQIIKMKRYSTAIRDILMRISGRKIKVVSEPCRQSLTNLFEHSQMIVSEAEAIQEILNSIFDRIRNTLMQTMNESMRVLTAFAAIFLPLTLISGIYGMNFKWMPELEWKYGYPWALFLMVTCAAGLLFLFKKKKWF